MKAWVPTVTCKMRWCFGMINNLFMFNGLTRKTVCNDDSDVPICSVQYGTVDIDVLVCLRKGAQA
jgi:hypothetical protein